MVSRIAYFMTYFITLPIINAYHKRIVFVRNLLVFRYTIWRRCFNWEVFVSIKRSIGHFGRIRGSGCNFVCCSSVSCRCCVCCCCVCCCCICCCRCCVFDGCIHRRLIWRKSVRPWNYILRYRKCVILSMNLYNRHVSRVTFTIIVSNLKHVVILRRL